MAKVKSLNGAQVATVAYLHALGPRWVNRHITWVNVLSDNSNQEPDALKAFVRVRVQISSSILCGTVVLCRATKDDPWILSMMESYIGFSGPLKQGVWFGYSSETKQIIFKQVD